jgi:hypothetical protein
MASIRETIVQVATAYLGQKEKPGNSGFQDSAFEKKMKAIGFVSGSAWCAFFAKLVWMESFGLAKPFEWVKVSPFLNPSAVATYKNFKSGSPARLSSTPKPGDLIVWQNYKNGVAHWTGHIGIVIEVNGEQLITIEGNSNSQGGREGIEVSKQKRKSTPVKVSNGLVLLGFISPE